MEPITRRGNQGYEDDPVRFNSPQWVCHHASRNSNVPLHRVTGGQKTQLLWEFGALHIGDCALYISYDYTLPLVDQQYFKIANLPDCKAQSNQRVDIDLPTWLPGGQAILRWDWYGVHGGVNNPEFYVQCVDIDITAGLVSSSSPPPVELLRCHILLCLLSTHLPILQDLVRWMSRPSSSTQSLALILRVGTLA